MVLYSPCHIHEEEFYWLSHPKENWCQINPFLLLLKRKHFSFRVSSCKADHTTELPISSCKVRGMIRWENKPNLDVQLQIFQEAISLFTSIVQEKQLISKTVQLPWWQDWHLLICGIWIFCILAFFASSGWIAFHYIMNNFLFLKYPAVHEKLCQVESDSGQIWSVRWT